MAKMEYDLPSTNSLRHFVTWRRRTMKVRMTDAIYPILLMVLKNSKILAGILHN